MSLARHTNPKGPGGQTNRNAVSQRIELPRAATSRPEIVAGPDDTPQPETGFTMHVVPNTMSYPETRYEVSPEVEALRSQLRQPPILKTKKLKRINETRKQLQISRLQDGVFPPATVPIAVAHRSRGRAHVPG